jgi:PKD domain
MATTTVRRLGFLAVLGGLSLAVGGLVSAQPLLPKDVIARGYISIAIDGRENVPIVAKDAPARDVYLPEVTVVLQEAQSGATTDPVLTDLSGRFNVLHVPPGRYHVCWEAFEAPRDCSPEIFSLDRWYRNLGTIRIPVKRESGTIVLYGTVTMKDRSSPRHLQPFANINAFARVSVLDPGGGVLRTVAVNNFGDYLLPAVPVRKDLRLRTQIEKAEHDQALEVVSQVPQAQTANVAVDNTPPRLEPLVAKDANGRRVKVARPADTVTLEARTSDPDGDAVMYRWVLSAGSGVLSSTSDPSVKWSLPAAAGTYAVTLYAFDGRGGYAESMLPLVASRQRIPFSGIVDATDAAAVPGAEVEVNGQLTLTDPRGFFQLRVADAQRFVLNIRKPGYGLISRIYDGPVPGGRWTLVRGEVFRIDPSRDNDIQNKRTQRECPGPASRQLDWETYPLLARPVFQDGKGNIVPAPKEIEQLAGLPTKQEPVRDCGPGLRVRIPANSFVDRDGNLPSGMVDVTLATVDLTSPGQIPGDDTVLLPDGTTKVMESFGAGTIEAAAGGKRFNLRPGAAGVEVVLPVDRSQIAAGIAPPARIPLLFYREREGLWVPEGEAVLIGSGPGAAYQAPVSHFSAVNMDNLKTNQACVRVLSPTAAPHSMPAQYRLEITLEQAGTAPIVRTVDIDDNASVQEHVLYNLPTGTNIVLVPIRKNSPDANLNNIPMGVFVVNTGGTQNPTTPNRPLGPPYNACATQVTLSDFGLQFFPDIPVDGAFLHGLYSFAATNLSETDPHLPAGLGEALPAALDAATTAYYGQVDPRGLRTTLACFKVTNGFPLKPGESCAPVAGFTPPTTRPEVAVAYANTVDLGFGREMHCVRDAQDVACYVTNYGEYTPPGSGSDTTKAQAAADALAGLPATPGATVAMEHTRIEDGGATGTPVVFSDPDRVVKFFAYFGGARVNKANLDLKGDRPIPQLCMVCHGGQYPGGATLGAPSFTTRNEVKLNSKFLPFDLQSLTFAAPPFDQPSQESEFRQLNEMVAAAPASDPLDPANTVIQDLIADWYPTPTSDQVPDHVVAGWTGNILANDLYRDTVARSCRTCHVTNAEPTLRFHAAADFNTNLSSVQLRVCKQHVMPHARRTHDLFWTSVGPNQPAQLQAYGDTVRTGGWQVVGTPGVPDDLVCANSFTAGGQTPPGSFYANTVQGIWGGNCVGCHRTGNEAAGLNLEPAVSFAELVNVSSTELGSMFRVAPNSTTTSYLSHKVNGSAGTVGGNPSQMPLGASPLGATDMNNIATWINGGAQP